MDIITSKIEKAYNQYLAAVIDDVAMGNSLVLSHFGVMDQELMAKIIDKVEQDLIDDNAPKSLLKRVFSVLVETTQNIRFHGRGDARGIQTSFIIVTKNQQNYSLITGNLISNEEISEITSRIDHINSLGINDLKDHYMDRLTNGVISSKGGAGLGLLTILLKSKNKLVYDVEHIDQELKCLAIIAKVIRE